MLLQTTQDTLSVAASGADESAPSVNVFSTFTTSDSSVAGLPTVQGSVNETITTVDATAVLGQGSRNGSVPTGKIQTVNFFSAINLSDSQDITVSVTLVNSLGVETTLKNDVTLLPGETLQYGLNVGFQILDANGFLKVSGAGGSSDSTEEGSEAAVDSAACALMTVKLLARLNNFNEDEVLAEMRDPDFLSELASIPA